jgi:hypothetical protein
VARWCNNQPGLRRGWRIKRLPLISPPSCLPKLVVASPLHAAAVAHCHSPAVHCAVAAVVHCNCAAIINSLCIHIWPLSPIATADNMVIVAPHSAITLLSCCLLCRFACSPLQLRCCTYWQEHFCVTLCCATSSQHTGWLSCHLSLCHPLVCPGLLSCCKD